MVEGGSNRRPEIVFTVDGIEYLPRYYSMGEKKREREREREKGNVTTHARTHTHKSFTVHRTGKSRMLSLIYFDRLKRNIVSHIFLNITFILDTGRAWALFFYYLKLFRFFLHENGVFNKF